MRFNHALLLAVLITAGCASGGGAKATSGPDAANADSDNYYTRSYVDKNRPTVALQPDPSGPKLYRGNVKEDDYQRMLRSGFELLGYSSFEAADVPPEQALEQARKIHADLVLVYSELAGSIPLSVRVQQLREKAMKAENGKAADGNTKPEVQKPDQQNAYAYFASYWVKLAPPLIGVHVKGPGVNDDKAGLEVLAVIKDSPAAKADIEEGDVLTRIGDIELSKPEALTRAAEQYAGKTVEVALKRNGADGKTSMTLNSRK
ncbi:MAG TPA: PDZ domain-containing protein [Methylophilaceae bacterium]|nr:PDZ domain-containing protein [Methylophilaceae bacterium]